MNIEKRIRATAAKKVKVRITGKVRSKGGFYVWYPGGSATAKTKREALQTLLAKVRCHDEVEFEISVRPPHRGDQKGGCNG